MLLVAVGRRPYTEGLGAKEALGVLEEQLEDLRELAHFYVAHISPVVRSATHRPSGAP